MKKITLWLALLLLISTGAYSQVQIGTGTLLDRFVPFEPVDSFSYSQSIYLASEINASGTITSLQWNYGGLTSMPNSQDLTIYLGYTSKTVFDSDTDWISISDLTPVYHGGIGVDGVGWVTIQFDTPFTYNGTDNLVVAVKENQPGSDDVGDDFYASAVTGNRSIFYSTSWAENNPNPVSPGPGYRNQWIPNVIFEGIRQDCATPLYVALSEIETTTATASWQETEIVASEGSQYYLSTSDVTPTIITEPSGSVLSGFSAGLTNLTPATPYYIWVRNSCGNNTYSAWSEVASFVTACEAVTEFYENFDSVTTPGIPLCWTAVLRGNSLNEYANIETGADQLTSSVPNSVHLGNANTANQSDEIFLISPKLSNLGFGTHRLKFNAKDMGGNDAPINLQILTLNSNSADADYNIFATVETQSAFVGTDYIVDFSEYTGDDTYIGFKLNAAGWGSLVYLDDIRWELIPACPDITLAAIQAVEISPNTANITWEQEGTENSWQLVYGEESVTDPNSINTIIDAASTDKLLTGLIANTKYKAWVRSVCQNGNGVWIGPVNFKIDCDAVTSFSENFDSTPGGELPDCWTKLINPGGCFGMGCPGVNVYEYPDLSHSEPNAVMLYNAGLNVAGGDDVILVSPRISNLGDGTHRFKFYAKTGAPNTIQVVTLSSNDSAASINVIQEFPTAYQTMEYIVNFDSQIGSTDSYIGLRLNAPGSSTIYVDDIVWEPLPPCSDVSNVTVPFQTETTAIVNWLPGNDETTWEVAYGAVTATDPFAVSSQAATVNPTATLAGLAPATQYKVWVRSVCQEGDGQWMGPVIFRTNCLPTAAIDENFDTTPINELPACWSKIIRGETVSTFGVIQVINSAPVSDPNSVSIYIGDSQPEDDHILVLPQLTNLSNHTHRLTFTARIMNFPGALQIVTLNNNSPTADYTVFETVTPGTGPEHFEIDFSDYAGSDTFIGIRLTGDYPHLAAYIDDVIWEPVPACPHVTGIELLSVSDSEAEFSWLQAGGESGWEIAYAPSSVTSPDALTPLSITGTPGTTLTGLSAATEYHVWLRSVCENGHGVWIGPITFTTDCVAVNAFNEDFDAVTAPQVPQCWTAILRGTTLSSMAVIETTAAGNHSAPNTISMYKGDSEPSDDLILVSPRLSNLDNHTNIFSFYGMMQNTTQGIFEIGTMDSNFSTGSFNTFQSFDATNVYQQYSVDFTTYSGTDSYIAIRLTSPDIHTVAYVDNTVWAPQLGADIFDAGMFAHYPNPVKDVLHLSYNKNMTNATIYNLLGQQVMAKAINANQAELDLSSLASGAYLVKVTADGQEKTIKVIKE